MNFCLEWEGRLFTTVTWLIYSSTVKSSYRTGILSLLLHIHRVICTVPILSWVSEGVWLHHKHPECSIHNTHDLHNTFALQCFSIHASEMQIIALHHFLLFKTPHLWASSQWHWKHYRNNNPQLEVISFCITPLPLPAIWKLQGHPKYL